MDDKQRKRWTLVATCLGSAMALIDGTAVNVAMPSIQNNLKATVADMQWVVNAYTLFLGALILTGGSSGDSYGRRRVFVIGISIFAVASLWCGLAPDVTQLIIARGVQGIGGALLVPSSLAIISAAFGEDDRGRAIGTWAAFSALTTAIGPLLGGWLVDAFSWRPIFFVNLPIALVAIAITLRYVDESRDPECPALDWWGAALATAGLGLITYGLISVGVSGWGNWLVITSLGAGAIMLVIFLVQEAMTRHPMMPLRLFGSRTFTGANLLTMLLYFPLFGGLFFLPFNQIQVQGYSASEAGAAWVPFVIIIGVLSRWSGGVIDRYGAKAPLVVGPIIAAGAYAWFAVPGIGGSYWTTFFGPTVLLGLGMAVCIAPLTTTVMGSVERSHAGVASGINNAVSRVSGLLAVAVCGIIALSIFSANLEERMVALRVPANIHTVMYAQREQMAAAKVPMSMDVQQRTLAKQAIDESFVGAFRVIMLISAAFAFASAVVGMTMIRDVRSQGFADN